MLMFAFALAIRERKRISIFIFDEESWKFLASLGLGNRKSDNCGRAKCDEVLLKVSTLNRRV